MANFFTIESTGFQSKPVVKPSVAAFGARVRRFRGSFNLSSITVTTADNVYLGYIPAGAVFCFGVITTTVSLGTSTLNIGLSQTHAANTQYATGIVITAVNAPALFGMVNDPGASLGVNFTSLPYGQTATWGTSEPSILPGRDVYLTVGTANLPTSNNLVTVDLYFGCE